MEAVLQTLGHGILVLVALAITAWISGALYFDIGRASKIAWILVFLWIAAILAVFGLWQPLWKPFLLLLATLGLFLSWWFSQKPSNDRNWALATAVLPKVNRCEDTITIDNVRYADASVSSS